MTSLRALVFAACLISSVISSAVPMKPLPPIDSDPNVRVRLKSISSHNIEVIGSLLKINNRSLDHNSLQISFEGGEWKAQAGEESFSLTGRSINIIGQSIYVDKIFLPPSITLVSQGKHVDVIANLPLET